MATIVDVTYESGTNGTACTPGNTGYTSVDSGWTFTNSPLLTTGGGSLAGKCLSTGAARVGSYTDVTATAAVYLRFYLNVTAWPISWSTVASFGAGATVRGDLRLLANGSLQMRNSAGVAIYTSAAGAVPVGSWCRVEWRYDNGAAQQQLRVYNGTDPHSGTTSIDSGAIATTAAGTVTRIRIGALGVDPNPEQVLTATNQSTGGTLTFTTTALIKAGRTIIVSADRGLTTGTTNGVASIVPSAGSVSAWSVGASACRALTHDLEQLAATVVTDIPAGSTILLTFTATTSTKRGGVLAVWPYLTGPTAQATSGTTATGGLSQTAAGPNGSGLTATATATGATTTADSLVVASFANGSTSGGVAINITPGTGYTEAGEGTSAFGASDRGAMQDYQVLHAVATPTATATYDTTSGWAAAVATYPFAQSAASTTVWDGVKADNATWVGPAAVTTPPSSLLEDIDFEGGTNGAACTLGNTAFNQLVMAGWTFANTPLLPTAGGAFSGKCTALGAGAAVIASHNIASSAAVYLRFYYYNSVRPSAIAAIAQLSDGTSGFYRAELRLGPNGELAMRHNAGVTAGSLSTILTTATGLVPLNAWCRIEWLYDNVNGVEQLRVFTGADLNGTNRTYDSGPITAAKAGAVTRVSVGDSASTIASTAFWDKIGVSATTWPGSATVSSTVTVDAGTNQPAVDPWTAQLDGVSHTGKVTTAGTITSYSWAQTAGPTTGVTITNATSATMSYKAPALLTSATRTFTLTVVTSTGTASDAVVDTVSPVNERFVSPNGGGVGVAGEVAMRWETV